MSDNSVVSPAEQCHVSKATVPVHEYKYEYDQPCCILNLPKYYSMRQYYVTVAIQTGQRNPCVTQQLGVRVKPFVLL